MRVDRRRAERVFDAAAAVVASGGEVPAEWVRRTERIGEASSKTFVAMLGTALLARATEPDVDPLALKATANAPRTTGYSARGVAQHALVPSALRHGVHLGVTGAEPLNNQPFYAEDRVHRGLPTRQGDREHLDALVDALEEVATMTAAQAASALAAFIAVRQEVQRQLRPVLETEGQATSLPALVSAIEEFISADAEGGRRGQAFAAAALDMAFDEVVTSKVNDPSRHGPGDVRAFDGDDLRLSAEVKQRPVTDTDVLLFAQALAAWPLPTGVYVALNPAQDPLPSTELNERALEGFGVGVTLLQSVGEVISAVTSWGLLSAEDLLERFPERMLARLEELEVSVAARREWAGRFATG